MNSPAPTDKEIVVGPVDIPVNVQGVNLNIRMFSFFSASTDASGLKIRARSFADLNDLQAKIGAIIDKLDVPRDNCASYSANNPVVTIHTKRLDEAGESAVLTVGGDVVLWGCVENPLKCSKVEWRNDGLFGTPSPTVTWWACNPPAKTILLQQNVTMTVPMTLEVRDATTAQLKLGQPNVQLADPRLAALLNLFRIDLNRIADTQLRSAIDPQRLVASLPEDFRRLNPKIEVARFTNATGHLGVELDLSGAAPSGELTEFLKIIVENRKPPS